MLLNDKNDLQLKRYIRLEEGSVPEVVGNIAINLDTKVIDVDHPTSVTALRAFLAELWVKEEYLNYEFPLLTGLGCRQCGCVNYQIGHEWTFAHPDRIVSQ